MPGRTLQFLYFIDYLQSISLNSQQTLATHQSHGLMTWATIVRSGPQRFQVQPVVCCDILVILYHFDLIPHIPPKLSLNS
jgi:hypothetical protein